MKMLPYEQQDLLLNHSLKILKSQDKDLDIVISKNISRSCDNFFPVTERTGTKYLVT